MRIREWIYIIASCSLLLNGCHHGRDIEDQRYTWSTDAPLTIPYRIRLQKFEKFNLLRNYSFETGRTFALDSSTTSFVLDGWQQVGRNIEWVDTRNDSLYKPDEVYSGFRAIKIDRKVAYETDEQGEGVISDFVKVIPGNYSLSLYARLENILPVKARLGTSMYDGVDIRLMFYDRNKMPVKPDFVFPHANQVIDASFKALSLSNFREIKLFGWGKIVGKSNHFPFPEGDIPSEAHYVKIFVGLKGTGTMWIDSISFIYSPRNFSVSERMQKFTDTTFTTQVALIPSPKKYTRMESVLFFKPDTKSDQLPIIVIPDDADELVMNAAQLIQKTFQQGITRFFQNRNNIPDIRIVHSGVATQGIEESRLIINLGNTALSKKYQGVIPLHEIGEHQQGYFIYSPADRPNLVLLGANTNMGLYYAALTIIQMTDDQLPVFHNARVVDYPDFSNRFYAIRGLENAAALNHQGESARELINYKLNGAFIVPATGDEPFSKVNRYDFLPPWFANGLFSVIKLPSYLAPDDSTLTYKYPIREPLNRISSADEVVSLYPANNKGLRGYERLVLPAVFNNEILDNSLNEYSCGFEADITCIYSGSSFYSLLTDEADIDRYSACMGPKPVFLDNSMLISSPKGKYNGADPYFPGRIRLYNIFEPFANVEIREYFERIDPGLYLINQSANSEIDIIRLATAADFLWNASNYSQEYALWKVLMSRYGVDNARTLIKYSDRYGSMLEILLRLEMKNSVARNLKSGQQTMTDLTSLVAEIDESIELQHRIVKELQQLNAELRVRLNHFAISTVVNN
jgi:hypothetical protein